MRRVLLSGASGGLGLEIGKSLLNQGFHVVMICNKNKHKLNGIMEQFPDRCNVLEIDFLTEIDYSSLHKSIGSVDSVIHCLGVSSSEISWKIEKLYTNQNNNKQIKIWLVLKNVFRVSGTALLIAHLLS